MLTAKMPFTLAFALLEKHHGFFKIYIFFKPSMTLKTQYRNLFPVPREAHWT